MKIHCKLFILLLFFKFKDSKVFEVDKLCKDNMLLSSFKFLNVKDIGNFPHGKVYINISLIFQTNATVTVGLWNHNAMMGTTLNPDDMDISIVYSLSSIQIFWDWRIIVRNCESQTLLPKSKSLFFATNIVVIGKF